MEHFKNDVDNLGSLDDGVYRYLKSALDRMLDRLGTKLTEELSAQRTRWLELLCKLVRVEPDGRTVTKKVFHEEFIAFATGTDVPLITDANEFPGLGYLSRADVGIVRCEGEKGGRAWTLGHDALGLALQKWNIVFNRGGEASMKMEMRTVAAAAKFTSRDLFGEDETNILDWSFTIPRDLLWDHQLPHFAQSQGFDKRLGIRFCTDDKLGPRNRDDDKGVATIGELKNQTLGLAAEPKHRGKVLVAYERSDDGFPGKTHSAASGASKHSREVSATDWSDVLVSDLFLGNCLIGPKGAPNLERLSDYAKWEKDKRIGTMSRALKKILEKLKADKAIVLCYDNSANAMLKLAAILVGLPQDYFDSDVTFQPLKSGELKLSDPFFREFQRRRAQGSAFDSDPNWMIGTAFGRALAVKAGYKPYFTSQHILELLKAYMANSEADRTNVTNLFQKMLLHTLWQVNIPPAFWNQGLYRPVVLRLASIGYFTASYILAEPQRLVEHLGEWLRGLDEEGNSSLGESVIKETVQDCFNFYQFDEYAMTFFDQDNTFAFWLSGQGNAGDGGPLIRSVACEIYMELVNLRRMTLEQFQGLCRSVDWLRQTDNYDLRVEDVKMASELKERAWRNFQILNFYDAERYMRLGADILDRLVERRGREQKLGLPMQGIHTAAASHESTIGER